MRWIVVFAVAVCACGATEMNDEILLDVQAVHHVLSKNPLSPASFDAAHEIYTFGRKNERSNTLSEMVVDKGLIRAAMQGTKWEDEWDFEKASLEDRAVVVKTGVVVFGLWPLVRADMRTCQNDNIYDDTTRQQRWERAVAMYDDAQTRPFDTPFFDPSTAVCSREKLDSIQSHMTQVLRAAQDESIVYVVEWLSLLEKCPERKPACLEYAPRWLQGAPSFSPKVVPTLPVVAPVPIPSVSPSVFASDVPTMVPTFRPSPAPQDPPVPIIKGDIPMEPDPTRAPTVIPSWMPSGVPSGVPTEMPFDPNVSPPKEAVPTVVTPAPTRTPSIRPSAMPQTPGPITAKEPIPFIDNPSSSPTTSPMPVGPCARIAQPCTANRDCCTNHCAVVIGTMDTRCAGLVTSGIYTGGPRRLRQQ